jgi:hypothetical protein
VAAAAGALAALLSRWDLVTDPVSLVGAFMLLGIPVALIAGIDWARNRLRAALVLSAMLIGTALQALTPQARDAVSDLVHHRIALALTVVAGICAVSAGSVWRSSRDGQRDAAG